MKTLTIERFSTIDAKSVLDNPYLIVAKFGPTLAAIITLLIFGGNTALKNSARKIFVFKFSVLRYLGILLTLPLVLFSVLKIFDITPVDQTASVFIYITLLASPINGLLGGFLNGVGPIGEEFGWRGFLLPELLSTYNDTLSSIILGLVWAFWHLPIFFFNEFRNGLAMQEFLVLYPLSTVLIAYFMTKVYHLSRGSIFMAIWVHGLVNTVLAFISDSKIWKVSHLSPLSFYLIVLLSLFLACMVIYIFTKFSKNTPILK